jgi:hypothetical protein
MLDLGIFAASEVETLTIRGSSEPLHGLACVQTRYKEGKMNKAPSFTPRDEIPSPTTSTRRGSSGPSTYAPSVADSTTSPPSTTTTTPLPWRKRTGRGSARSYVPPAAASLPDISGTGQHRLVIGIDYGTTFTGELLGLYHTIRGGCALVFASD